MGKFLFWFIIISAICCLIFGPASLIVSGIVTAFYLTCLDEYRLMSTKSGRQRIQKRVEIERRIENYWGTIDYRNK